jgi:urate oxidase
MPAPVTLLGANQYGKAEVRLVRVTRDTDRHEIEDLSVTSQLRGDFEAAHRVGDNAHVVATDTQKNTVYAFAKEHGVGSPERFLLTLGRHFVDGFDWVTGGRWQAEQYSWSRIGDHDHAFVRSGAETRTCVVHIDEGSTHVVSGLTDCVVAKTTGSEFTGFPRDRYTTLAETTDRILATSVTAWWRYAPTGPVEELDFDALYDGIRATLLAAFANVHSLALQQTLFAMGTAVIEGFPDVAECRFSMPNKHHFLVDLEPFGLDNPGEVFYAADRPYGLIEAAVLREGAPEAGNAWSTVPGFC